jgi:hypothetical protein
MADIISLDGNKEKWGPKELLEATSGYLEEMDSVLLMYYDKEGTLKYGACNMSPKDALYAIEYLKLSILQDDQ